MLHLYTGTLSGNASHPYRDSAERASTNDLQNNLAMYQYRSIGRLKVICILFTNESACQTPTAGGNFLCESMECIYQVVLLLPNPSHLSTKYSTRHCRQLLIFNNFTREICARCDSLSLDLLVETSSVSDSPQKSKPAMINKLIQQCDLLG